MAAWEWRPMRGGLGGSKESEDAKLKVQNRGSKRTQ